MHSVEKGIDDAELDSISVQVRALLSPGPTGGLGVTGDTVATGVTACATVTQTFGLESGKEFQPVISGSVLDISSVPDNVPQPVSTAVERQVPRTSSLPLNGVLSVQNGENASLPTPMEVCNHASLGLTPSHIENELHEATEPKDTSPDAPPATQPMSINSVDFSAIPAWLSPHMKHFKECFRGELEDKILGAFVALEMSWQPVSILPFCFDCMF